METDLTIFNHEKTLIVDAKYYKDVFSSRNNIQKFHSTNLYQLMSYLLSYKIKNNANVKGLLIYPQTAEKVAHKYTINGFEIGIYTINLDQDWKDIHHDLLFILKCNV